MAATNANPPVTPARMAYFIAVLLVLSVSTAIAIARYPDERFVTQEQATSYQRTNPVGFDRARATSAAAAEAATPYVVAFPENFPQKARILGSATAVAVALFALGMRRRLDVPPGV